MSHFRPRSLLSNTLSCSSCGWIGSKSDAKSIIRLAPAHVPRNHICPKCGDIIYAL